MKRKNNKDISEKLLEDLWNMAPPKHEPLDHIWDEIKSKAFQKSVIKQAPSYKEIYVKIIRSAAILLIFLSISLIIYFNSRNIVSELPINYLTTSVPFGQKEEIYLSDGTHVYLNSGSSIKYPQDFAQGGSRRVFLSGEAYFEVKKNPLRPFIVTSGAINIKALGTSFNITAYDQDVETTLISGSVVLYYSTNGISTMNNIILKPGQIGSYSEDMSQFSVKEINPEYSTAWKDGVIIIRDKPLKEVINRLERWYNVTIVLADEGLLENSYTINIQDENISEVLELLKRTTRLDYQINENSIKITRLKE